MPDKETIISRVRELVTADSIPTTPTNSWKSREPGGVFTISKVHYPKRGREPAADIYILTISGLQITKERIVNDFINALGTPQIPPHDPFGKGTLNAAWNAEVIDNNLNDPK